MRKTFIAKLRVRYSSILCHARNSGIQPVWCPPDVWQAWRRMWNSSEFKRKCELGKKARAGKNGVAVGTHTGGSCSFAKTAKKLEQEKGESVTADELFLWTHTHEHDGVNFVNDRSKELQAHFENLHQPNQTPETVSQAIDHVEAFYRACGGITRGMKIFGLGLAGLDYYGGRLSAVGASSSTSNGAENTGQRTILQNMQERLDAFNADRAHLLEHVQQMNDRQQRLEHSVDALHLGVDPNENREIMERLANIEAQMGPMLSKVQNLINQFQSEE